VLVESERIAFVYIDTQVIKMITIDNEIYFMNDTLEDIYRQLDPQQFYRANRQQIINRDVIKDISTSFGNKILVNLKIPTTEKITISKGRAAEFKKWLAKG
jgi:two-component system LytT family response regulator